MHRPITWLAWVVLVGLSMAPLGCSSKPPGANAEATGELTDLSKKTAGGFEPARADILIQAYNSDPRSLNAVISNDTISSELQTYVYQSLCTTRMAEPEVYIPSLATEWSFDDKTLEFSFKLRKGVYWHPINLPDGTPLPKTEFTSCDVKFTFDCILNKYSDAGATRSYYMGSDGKPRIKVTRDGRYGVKIKWLSPYFLADQFTFSQAIIPKHVYSVDKNGDPISLDYSSKEFAEGFNSHWANGLMCGTGPMMLKYWQRNEEFSLVRYPEFWGEPYYFSEIIFQNTENQQTLIKKATKGELDWAQIIEKDVWLEAKDKYNNNGLNNHLNSHF